MEIIGQKNNIEKINNMIDNFPKFLVLVGKKGSGKKTLSKYIATQLNAGFAMCGIKVDEIRDTINTAMLIDSKTVYCIADADNMSVAAKNAMLKVTEEPPNNAYFILTVCNEYTLLDTIKSRAMLLNMDKYSIVELMHYNPSAPQELYDIADNFYELDLLLQYGNDFLDYVDLVFENIALVESANAFKSSKSLALKSDDGYDLGLFWKAFIIKCYKKQGYYAKWLLTTAKCLYLVNRAYSNKEMLYDYWVLSIRRDYL